MESSAINAPHPDGEPSFAGPPPDLTPEQAAEEGRRYREQHGEPEPESDHEAQQALKRAIAERERAETEEAPQPTGFADPFDEEDEPEQDPTQADDDGTTGSTTEPEAAGEPQSEEVGDPAPASDEAGDGAQAGAQPTQSPASAEDAKTRGAVEREYIVFHRIALTERVLKHLLDQLKNGDLAEPRVAFMEIHREITRNDKQAIGAAYDKHAERLGDTADLAAVSTRSFKQRRVQPEEVPQQRRIRIS